MVALPRLSFPPSIAVSSEHHDYHSAESSREHSSAEISREHPYGESSATLLSALQLGRDELERDVIVWQRWLRYLGVATVVLVLILFTPQSSPREIAIPLLFASVPYVLFTFFIAVYLARGPRREMPRWVPDALVAADILETTALVYLSSPPAQFHRILFVGLLVLQLSAFYFGRGLGFRALIWVVASYVLMSFFVPPHVPGVRPLGSIVGITAGLFLFTSGVLILIFGEFRERMNRFRILCLRAERGDLGGSYDVTTDRLPDDLTLLGRSFNDMRGRLVELIGTDPLTGCLNRRALEDRLGREWRIARRRQTAAPIAVLAIDLDRFKDINDALGHGAGDYVLHEIGKILQSTARDTDSVARTGGDEFVVVLPDTGWQGATTFAERVRSNVHEHFFVHDGKAMQVTISVGVHVGSPSDPQQGYDQLLDAADRSLYKAKTEGRNRVAMQPVGR
jgi:diguanylate cyclase (GGDEF)-like protein